MQKIIILYDSKCDFCTSSVKALKKIDWLGALELRDLFDTKSYKDLPKISIKEAAKIVHAVSNGNVQTGFFAFRILTWRIPLLWPLAPILYLPGTSKVGRVMYKWISERR